MLWRELYAEAATRLGSTAEARWLVEEAAGGPLSSVLDELVTARAARWLAGRLERRAAGEPLQYVLGRWPFRTVELLVDRRVLIPRPETEQVVEVALAELRRRDAGSRPLAVDLGTGSGAIALSLAAEHTAVTVWGTDASGDALDVARANLAGLGGSAAARVRLVAGDWWDALPVELRGTVDLAVANPPYISVPEMADLDAVVADWEPHAALQSGPDGLDDIRRILDGARHWLAPGGALVMEMAPHQAKPVVELARRAGLADAEVHPDLAGRDRTMLARRPPP